MPPLTPAQLIAARRLLRWSRERLAAKMQGEYYPIRNFETTGVGAEDVLTRARQVLEAAGVEFISEDGGAGVRLRQAKR